MRGGGGGFVFNDTATPEIYTLSLHDALPIFIAQAPNREQRLLLHVAQSFRFGH